MRESSHYVVDIYSSYCSGVAWIGRNGVVHDESSRIIPEDWLWPSLGFPNLSLFLISHEVGRRERTAIDLPLQTITLGRVMLIGCNWLLLSLLVIVVFFGRRQ